MVKGDDGVKNKTYVKMKILSLLLFVTILFSSITAEVFANGDFDKNGYIVATPSKKNFYTADETLLISGQVKADKEIYLSHLHFDGKLSEKPNFDKMADLDFKLLSEEHIKAGKIGIFSYKLKLKKGLNKLIFTFKNKKEVKNEVYYIILIDKETIESVSTDLKIADVIRELN